MTKIIKTKIKELRLETGISQVNLAKKLNIPLKKICKIELTGILRDEIDFKTVYKFSKYFNVQIEDLFEDCETGGSKQCLNTQK